MTTEIPRFVSQATPQGGNARTARAPLSLADSGLNDLAESVSRAALGLDAEERREDAEAKARQDKNDRLAARADMARLRANRAGRLQEQAREIAPGGDGFMEAVIADFDKSVEAFGHTIERDPNGGVQISFGPDVSQARAEVLELEYLNIRADLAERSAAIQAVEKQRFRVQNLEDTIELHANLLRSDAEGLGERIEDVKAAIHAAGFNPETTARLAGEAEDRLARSAIEGLNERTPGAALALLESGDLDGYLKPASMDVLRGENSSALRREQAEAERIAREERATMQADVRLRYQDAVAQIRNEGRSSLVSETDIRAAFEPAEADILVRELQAERDQYAARTEIALAPPERVAEILSGARPEGEGYAVEAERFDLLVKAARDRQTALAKDPAAYSMASSPEVRRAFADAGDDPEALRAAYETRMEVQRSLGVRRPTVLAAGEAAALAGHISSAAPQERARAADSAMSQFGDPDGPLWRSAFGELVGAGLDPHTHVLMAVRGNPRVEAVVANVIEIGRTELRRGVPDADVVFEGVDGAIADFVNAAALGDPSGGRTVQINGIVTAAQDVALHYRRQGLDATAAAEKAVRDVVTEQNAVVGTYYVPTTLDGETIEPSRVSWALERAQTRAALEEFGIAAFESRVPGLSEESRRSAAIRAAVNYGFWVTEGDGRGAVLMVPQADGGDVPVLNGAGEPYRVDFREANARVPNPPSSLSYMGFSEERLEEMIAGGGSGAPLAAETLAYKRAGN